LKELRSDFITNSFLYKSRQPFFRQICICANADNYFTVKFLSAKLQRTIFSSNSFLQKCGQLFFRQICICANAENYFSVKFLSAKIRTTILPSNMYLRKCWELFFRQNPYQHSDRTIFFCWWSFELYCKNFQHKEIKL